MHWIKILYTGLLWVSLRQIDKHYSTCSVDNFICGVTLWYSVNERKRGILGKISSKIGPRILLRGSWQLGSAAVKFVGLHVHKIFRQNLINVVLTKAPHSVHCIVDSKYDSLLISCISVLALMILKNILKILGFKNKLFIHLTNLSSVSY